MDEENKTDNTKKSESELSISSDLIRGHINTIILRALYDRDKYGYEIINEIEEKSRGQYSLKQPTLYSALKRLESQDYVTSYWGTGDTNGGRRKYFQITEKGRAIVEQNLAEWEYSRTIIDSLISEKDYDFSNPPPAQNVDFSILKKSTTRVPMSSAKADDEDIPEDEPEESAESPAAEETRIEETVIEVPAEEPAPGVYDGSILFEERPENPYGDGRSETESLSAEAGTNSEISESAPSENAADSENPHPDSETAAFDYILKNLMNQYPDLRDDAEETETPAEDTAPEEPLPPEQPTLSEEVDEDTPYADVKIVRQPTEEELRRIHENYEKLVGDAPNTAFYEASQREYAKARGTYTEETPPVRENSVPPYEPPYQPPYEEPAPQEPYQTPYGQAPYPEAPYQPPYEEPAPQEPSYTASQQAAADLLYSNRPIEERNYKDLIARLYKNEPKEPACEEPPPAPEPNPAPEPAPAPEPQFDSEPAPAPVQQPAAAAAQPAAQTSGYAYNGPAGVQFYDVLERAEQDGLKVTTANGKRNRNYTSPNVRPEGTFDKGRLLFITALWVFAVALIESIVCACLKNVLNLSVAYIVIPFVLDVVFLLAFVILYIKGYGKNCRKGKNHSYLSATLIVYVNILLIICLIAFLVIGFNGTLSGANIVKTAVLPCIYLFNVPLFAIIYYLLYTKE